ncbi:phage virion morphogenesis protein [Acinetobacter stercoris]|uniref:Phage virion morphogenesis family protein n=1 Tax=Acinetobacter stercoris TaxID=2126983 RepID=A0A2U3MY01_9GAMM|nr:phage virion morphogenesis protein [Acinetobacter stercoris]SPL70310.1 Phage virion morphogenesis family protein [Acinetobacter stercoris]
MAVAITVRAENESVVMEILQHYLNLDYAKVFDEIGAYGVSSSQMRFINQSDVEGNPWQMSWRASLQGGQILRDTGRLMNSLTHNVIGNGVEWGTNVEYAAPLHFGAVIMPKTAEYLVFNVSGHWRKSKEVHIEPRSFLGLDHDDEESIINIVRRFIDG